MGRTSDGVKQLIERVFCAKKKIELAIYERKHGYGASTFTTSRMPVKAAAAKGFSVATKIFIMFWVFIVLKWATTWP